MTSPHATKLNRQSPKKEVGDQHEPPSERHQAFLELLALALESVKGVVINPQTKFGKTRLVRLLLKIKQKPKSERSLQLLYAMDRIATERGDPRFTELADASMNESSLTGKKA